MYLVGLSRLPTSLVSSRKSLVNTSKTRTLAAPVSLARFTSSNVQEKQETSATVKPDTQPKKSFFKAWLEKDISADKSFNRYKLLPASVLTHVCLGSCYAWSVINEPIIRSLGVVTSASADWTLASIAPVFSLMFLIHGLSAAVLGKWQERVGPRAAGILGGISFGGGFVLGGIGILTHQWWLLLMGYGFFGGLGMGFAYVPPMANLIRWFPDKRGLTAGLILMGFGGGAGVAIPIMQRLLNYFQQAPTYLGPVDAVQMITKEGKRFVEIGNELKEVVVASASDLVNLPGISEGVYLVGTGTTGAGQTLVCLGLAYATLMFGCSLMHRTPPPNYCPPGWTPPPSTGMISTRNVHVDTVMKTPQFWLMWTSFWSLAASGMALLFVAKTMMSDIFATALPLLVTSGFASAYVMSMSVANLGGRLAWASLSDYIGRKNVFVAFFALGIPLFLATPYLVSWVSANPGMLPLALFYGSTLVIISIFGAAYACMPAYEADLFGTKYCGAVHGRMLTASAVASATGPTTMTLLRSRSETNAIMELAAKVDPEIFYQRFGVQIQNLEELIQAKTVTIKNLLELLPADTVDPTAFVYNTSLYAAAGALCVGALATLAVRPIAPKYFMDEEVETKSQIEMTPASALAHFAVEGDVWVVGLDASTLAEDVFQFVDKSADKKKDRIIFVAVSNVMNSLSVEAMPCGEMHTNTASAANTLSNYIKRAEEKGMPIDVVLAESGNVGEALTAIAKIKKATHLVLGGGKKSGLKGLGIGSVANYCTQHAPCSVTIVRVHEESPVPEFTETTEIEWVPVPTDEFNSTSVHLWERKRAEA